MALPANWAVVHPLDPAAANLLEQLERIHPMNHDYPQATFGLGRWLLEVWARGAIGDDTVIWLHRMLLPDARACDIN